MRVVALVGLSLAILAAGCGSQTSASSQAKPKVVGAPLAKAADRVKAEGTSRFAYTGKMTSEGESATFRGQGVFDFKRLRGRASVDFSNLADEGAVDPAVLTGELRFIDDRAFMHIPLFALVPGAKGWIEFRDSATTVDEASDDLMEAGGGGDPSTVLSVIRAAGSDVTEEGTEVIRGVETTRYSAKVDLSKAIEVAPKYERAQFRRALKRVQDAGVETIAPVEAWIDHEGLARRVHQTWPEVDGEQFEMTFDYFDFGVPVQVRRPPADQVMSEQEFDAMTETSE